ncbi:S1 family peptidase [Haloactinomyces albus]|uniref:Secreted trypsin-like serine protease n=1 Tax=Haloactinomyces albus TaxID=1352928 RepID=A0AAE3Z995_9ACTN|nr:serine protease [Haloactinomyces albus]MDR7300681.1 secreted trypsin-like serine protease [Haloactinomyces albus]
MRGGLRRMRSLWGLLAALTLWSVWALTSSAALADSGVLPPDALDREPIVGGQPADITEYPWVVYLTNVQGVQFCGGTIVRATKIVTAAHCVAGKMPAAVRVVAGRQDKQTAAGTVARVGGIWIHPDYRSPLEGADVAVLTLVERIPRQSLPPASPQDGELYRAGTRATVLGWGATSEDGSTSRVLRKVTVPVVGDAECSEAYPSRYSSRVMMCAGLPQGGVDGCQGDSGGPLVAGGRLIGIVSWGRGCARPGSPGVYTRVLTYHQDIRQQLE